MIIPIFILMPSMCALISFWSSIISLIARCTDVYETTFVCQWNKSKIKETYEI